MSVILVTPSGLEVLGTTLEHLREQDVRKQLEVVIAAPSSRPSGIESAGLDGFWGCQIVPVGDALPPQAKAAAIRRANGPIIVLGEEHCFPAPGWAAALIAAHRAPWAGVGPALGNANPSTALSWSAMMLHYGPWIEPAGAGTAEAIAWHNGSYKRDLLLDYGERLADLLGIEGILQADLRARGHRLCFESAARVRHLNISRLRPWIVHGFLGGRIHGAIRSRHGHWSRVRRLAYALGSPLVPAVRLPRILPRLRRHTSTHDLLPRIVPALIVGLAVHALGEAVGYIAGIG